MKQTLIGLAALVMAPLASADIYQYSVDNFALGNGGSMDNLFAEYDDSTGNMTWQIDNALWNGDLMDGFWLVTNDGPDNPKGDDGLAIFYADFNAGSLWSFAYNGQNNPNSYTSGEYLGDFSAGLINSGAILGFSMDVSSIYAQLPTSVPFDDQIGVWFHPTWGTSTITDENGRLIAWSYKHASWYDRAGKDTVTIEPDPNVPVPAPLLLIATALIGLGYSRKR